MIQRTRARTARIGVFCVGLNTYWGQFPGLLDNLMGYHDRFKALLPENVEVIDYGTLKVLPEHQIPYDGHPSPAGHAWFAEHLVRDLQRADNEHEVVHSGIDADTTTKSR